MMFEKDLSKIIENPNFSVAAMNKRDNHVEVFLYHQGDVHKIRLTGKAVSNDPMICLKCQKITHIDGRKVSTNDN